MFMAMDMYFSLEKYLFHDFISVSKNFAYKICKVIQQFFIVLIYFNNNNLVVSKTSLVTLTCYLHGGSQVVSKTGPEN